MIAPRVLLLSLLPVFAGCQSLRLDNEPPPQPTERLQGTITQRDGALHFSACQGRRNLVLLDSGATGLPDDARALIAGSNQPLFADIRGRLKSQTGDSGQLHLTQVYRLQAQGRGCNDDAFSQLLLLASGHEPGWSVTITGSGLLLERSGQPAVALPYLQEQLPSGQTSFSTEANNQRLDLWVAPQRCLDSATGAVSHLTAELRVNGQTLRGCAYYGGAHQN
ncbi:COG3650 family protein [Stutzerimonas zhaodongensis]|uniref:COG3650 family protein n=1 Tax=Stutzerimonas TaxID=2901164 RepID=UPI00388DDCB7